MPRPVEDMADRADIERPRRQAVALDTVALRIAGGRWCHPPRATPVSGSSGVEPTRSPDDAEPCRQSDMGRSSRCRSRPRSGAASSARPWRRPAARERLREPRGGDRPRDGGDGPRGAYIALRVGALISRASRPGSTRRSAPGSGQRGCCRTRRYPPRTSRADAKAIASPGGSTRRASTCRQT